MIPSSAPATYAVGGVPESPLVGRGGNSQRPRSTMMDFRVRCPKCKSTNTTVTRDQKFRWGAGQQALLVLHCYVCGYESCGAKAEGEIETQHAAWEEERAKPKEVDPAIAARAAAEEARWAAIKVQREAEAEAERLAAIKAKEEEVKRLAKIKAQQAVQAKADAEEARLDKIRLAEEARIERIHLDHVARLAEEARLIEEARLAEEARLEATRLAEEAQIEAIRQAEATPPVHVGVPSKCAWMECSKPSSEKSKYCSETCKNHYARFAHELRKKLPRALAKVSDVSQPVVSAAPPPVLTEVVPVTKAPRPTRVSPERKSKRKSPVFMKVTSWAKYDAMGEAELLALKFVDLRKYAAYGCGIKGACKIIGTKHDLVLRCLGVRQEQQTG